MQRNAPSVLRRERGSWAGPQNWVGFGEIEREEGDSNLGENTLRSSKVRTATESQGQSHQSALWGRPVLWDQSEKEQNGSGDGTVQTGTEGQAKDGCVWDTEDPFSHRLTGRQKSVSSDKTPAYFTNPTHQENQDSWRVMVICPWNCQLHRQSILLSTKSPGPTTVINTY